jgi:DNA-binding PadR family transcriptional regulator
MQQPRLVVLGLIATGQRYGFEMERFAEQSRMRMWAQIGQSTIYKILRDLERDGAITAKREKSMRGPGRVAYALTEAGRAELAERVGEALASRESVYSDRIPGLVFSTCIPEGRAREMLTAARDGMGEADKILAAEAQTKGGDSVAAALIEYYRAVYAAERRAMERMLDALHSPG